MQFSPVSLALDDLRPWLAHVIGSARASTGWSQRELARRAATSQATIWRLEQGRAENIDVADVERILAALGLHGTLAVSAVAHRDRERQQDGVHSVLNGFVGRGVERRAFRTALEVQIGYPHPRGWIDLVGFREEDEALLIEESKGDLPNLGELQRQIQIYEGAAHQVAETLGWRARHVVSLVVALDSRTVAGTLAANRDTVARAFPGSVDALLHWIESPGAPPPEGRVLAVANPRTRAAAWLRAPILGASRRRPAFESYADAAARLLPRSAGRR